MFKKVTGYTKPVVNKGQEVLPFLPNFLKVLKLVCTFSAYGQGIFI